ncbi:MAG: DUF1361 domain-containing protein [Clostridiales bacterium]|jgi:uncharacterized membrane protein|nr:DUF1361 domain-containing protein [Clostridiales bacterium]
MKKKWIDTMFLSLMSLFCLALFVARAVWTGKPQYAFLNWNLFLAAIPWGATTAAKLLPKKASYAAMVILFPVWLIFFPNSPYILTDLYHIGMYPGIPNWLDLIHILCYAWTALLFGFFSLMDLEEFLGGFMGRFLPKACSAAFLFLAGFGVYLGRTLRWNSWDILSAPKNMLQSIWTMASNPLSNKDAWGMTILLGLFLNAVYISIHLFVSMRVANNKPQRA